MTIYVLLLITSDYTSTARLLICKSKIHIFIHAGVKARSILLVLQASLGQVNGKHTGYSYQASDTPID